MKNPLFTDTITVYNHLRVAKEDKWRRTVIRGVQIQQKVKSEFTNNAVATYLTETSITIPFEADTDGKQYVAPGEYTGTGWTLNPADGLDVIVLGVCEQETGSDCTIDTLIKEYSAVTINAATDNTRRTQLKHWKAVCV